MENNSLRTGNYVWENYGGIYIVREIREKELIISKTKTTIAVGYKYSEIKGIELNDKLLLSFGFELVEDNFHFYDKGFSLDINGSITRFWLNETVVDIKYVHQLQNLYFALTQKELPLTDALPSQK